MKRKYEEPVHTPPELSLPAPKSSKAHAFKPTFERLREKTARIKL